ncbi:MAG: histidine ammonia-lyase, partial [Candidatus Bipolaricaulota bacterium]
MAIPPRTSEVVLTPEEVARREPVRIHGEGLSIEDLSRVARGRAPVELDDDAVERIGRSRAALEAAAAEPARAIYGVNTGFGRLASTRIGDDDVASLQANLIASHAAGVGPAMEEAFVRGAMLLRANTLAKGYSGVRPCVVETLVALLNAGVHPVVPSYGSLGASGDLIPLAHVASVLLGGGTAEVSGRLLDGAEALRVAGCSPVTLVAKEGLALINGTPFMTAVAALAVDDAQRLLDEADILGALTVATLGGSSEAFRPSIHAARPHRGQSTSAAVLFTLLDGLESPDHVQDPYSLRCIPQVHGAIRDAAHHARAILEIEMNAATDNPLVFADTGEVLSGGNFHGEPVALVADYVKLAMTDLAAISERRTNRLLHPDLNRGLPPFLAQDPGLGSGLMLAQYTAAALVSRCRTLAHPASADSMSVSGDQEDHVSMGMHAALHLSQVVEHAATVLGVELACVSQALTFADRTLPPPLAELGEKLRAWLPPLEDDAPPRERIETGAALLRRGALSELCAQRTGEAR